jgi:hypothetical protein
MKQHDEKHESRRTRSEKELCIFRSEKAKGEARDARGRFAGKMESRAEIQPPPFALNGSSGQQSFGPERPQAQSRAQSPHHTPHDDCQCTPTLGTSYIEKMQTEKRYDENRVGIPVW